MPQSTRLRHWIFLAIALSAPNAAPAHESWIEPLDYSVQVGDRMQAHLKVGQNFKGNTFAYLPSLFKFFDMVDSKGRRPVEGRQGDTPAVTFTAENDGLLVMSFRSTTNLLTYTEWVKFADFVKAHKLDWVIDKHRERGLPETNFVEGYFRFSKTLVKIGQGQGQDVNTGMPFELVALTNPYATPAPQEMRFQLYWQNQPFANSLVNVFRRPNDGSDTIKTTLSSDANGIVTVPVEGGGEYLVNSVHMIEPTADFNAQTRAVWVSLWASETFRIE